MRGSEPQPTTRRAGARELTRRAVTAEISALAIDLFEQRGYEQTTVADICDAAGISRTTFFRYFAGKEQTLWPDLNAMEERLVSALGAQPAQMTSWRAMRRTLDPLLDYYEGEAQRTLRVARLVIANPSLVGFHREKLGRWSRALEPELARRMNIDPHDACDPRPMAVINMALAALDAALVAWAAGNGSVPLAALVDQAIDASG